MLGCALCAVPASIAVAECFLSASLAVRVITLLRGGERLSLPRVFWFWLVWAGLEVLAFFRGADIRTGQGEIRHLLLIAALFVMTPALHRPADRVAVWRGVVLTATISSAVLIVQFIYHARVYRGGLDPVVYLRGGGLLHHWMVYGTVEILVIPAILELWQFYPEERWWLLPVAAINSAAVVLSLTRMLWICGLLLLVWHSIWTRSRWLWTIPVFPCLFLVIVPGVRARIADSAQLAYYSNSERLQMLQVGWRMISERPWTGVGPGRVDNLYTSYLSAGDPVPAYHGHLHNNIVQLGAEFGLPVLGAAMATACFLFVEMRKGLLRASNRDQRFLCRVAILGLSGFLAAGMFDYTYGHSLGVILLGYTVLAPFGQEPDGLSRADAGYNRD